MLLRTVQTRTGPRLGRLGGAASPFALVTYHSFFALFFSSAAILVYFRCLQIAVINNPGGRRPRPVLRVRVCKQTDAPFLNFACCRRISNNQIRQLPDNLFNSNTKLHRL